MRKRGSAHDVRRNSISQANLIMNWVCRCRVADNSAFGLPRRNVDRDAICAAKIANFDFDVVATAVLCAYPVLMQIFVGDVRSHVSPDY